MSWSGGLYVHVPFCAKVCPYCDFAVVAGLRYKHGEYLGALRAEARAWAGFTARTVFVGGGTPSFVDPGALAATLTSLMEMFEVPSGAEFSVECNPESVSTAGVRALADAGVNRVSIGAQSFDPAVLSALGRTHGVEDISAAVGAARRGGVGNISLDLIFGAPGENDASWASTLRAALALEPSHLSCYALTIEDGTRFARRRVEVDEDALATRYEIACEVLGGAGFRHYEVSNWARPGYESAHNLIYWTQGDYLGLGLGAHSHRDGHRWWNTRRFGAYLRYPSDATAGEERLTDAQRTDEWLMLRLRLDEGVPLDEAEARLGRPLPVGPLVEGGLATVEAGILRLRPTGLLLGNRIAAILSAA